MTFLSQGIAVAVKDLRIELRAHHALGVVLPFAGTVLIAFGLSLGPDRTLLQHTAPGLLWLAVLFASVLSFRGTYDTEAEDGAIEEVLLSPLDKGAYFLGKTAAVALQLLVLELAVVSLTVALFDVSFGSNPALLVGSFGLGTVGLSAVGNLFGVLAASAHAREAVLPLLVLPVAIPVLIAGVKATTLAQTGHGAEVASWLSLLLVFDLIYLSVGSLLFGSLLED